MMMLFYRSTEIKLESASSTERTKQYRESIKESNLLYPADDTPIRRYSSGFALDGTNNGEVEFMWSDYLDAYDTATFYQDPLDRSIGLRAQGAWMKRLKTNWIHFCVPGPVDEWVRMLEFILHKIYISFNNLNNEAVYICRFNINI